MDRNPGPVAVVAPTRASARSAASFLSRRLGGAATACSLAGYLASARAPGRIVLCPSGRSLEREIDFLRAASERALWKPPDEIVLSAIEGLLGSLPPGAARGRSRPRRTRGSGTALLLEGKVTSARARAALASDARLWIVEHPRRVYVSRPLMERLRRIGVRWSALDPVTVVAVLASPRLAAARSRWRGLLPPGTLLWIRPEGRRSAGGSDLQWKRRR
jgi:hypothetical protein